MIHQDCVRRVARRGGGRADGRLVDDRRRADRRPLRARDARSPVPRRSRGGAAGILRPDPRDADVLRDADRRAARHRVDGRGRDHSGRAADVPLDQGRVSALLQQRAEGSGGAGPGAARLPPAPRVSVARDRHSAPASAGRPARGRHDADTAPPVSAGPFRTERGAAARPRSAAGQRSSHRRERHGDHRRRRCRPGRGDVPGHRFAHPAAGGRVSNERAGRLPIRQLFARPRSWPSMC